MIEKYDGTISCGIVVVVNADLVTLDTSEFLECVVEHRHIHESLDVFRDIFNEDCERFHLCSVLAKECAIKQQSADRLLFELEEGKLLVNLVEFIFRDTAVDLDLCAPSIGGFRVEITAWHSVPLGLEIFVDGVAGEILNSSI